MAPKEIRENQKKNNNESQTKVKKPKKSKKSRDQKFDKKYVFAKRVNDPHSEDLFHYRLWSSSEDEDDDDYLFSSLTIPTRTSLTNEDLEDALDSRKLRKELTLHKWLLNNLIKLRHDNIKERVKQARLKLLSISKLSKDDEFLHYDTTANTKQKKFSSIRKGKCCYIGDNFKCQMPSLPYTRHCFNHILYNVDQQLFARCVAKSSSSLTQCNQPIFHYTNDEPLCEQHKTELREQAEANNWDAKGNKKRKKSKPKPRVSRRGKKKIKTVNENEINNSADSTLVEETSPLQPQTELSFGIDNLPLQSVESTIVEAKDAETIPVVQPPVSVDALPVPMTTVSLIPSTSVSVPITTSGVMLNQQFTSLPLLAQGTVNSFPSNEPSTTLPSTPGVHSHILPDLEPETEALVASLVAELPNLTSDSDLGDLKLTDEFLNFFC